MGSIPYGRWLRFSVEISPLTLPYAAFRSRTLCCGYPVWVRVTLRVARTVRASGGFEANEEKRLSMNRDLELLSNSCSWLMAAGAQGGLFYGFKGFNSSRFKYQPRRGERVACSRSEPCGRRSK